VRNRIRLIKEERKAPILKPPVFGCLKDTPSINITRGCAFSCVYCYARGFTNAPPGGEVYYYSNLLELLERELERKARRRRLPRWVTFSTASDPFQPFEETQHITYRVMEGLLKMGVGISFLTKGYIPQGFIHLFGSYPHLVKARIGLVSLREGYQQLYEPLSAPPPERLENIRHLIEIGVDTVVRIDPVIPGVTDSEDDIGLLMGRLSEVGIKEVSVSYLILRPSIVGQFFRGLSFKMARDVLRLYHGQPYQQVITSAYTQLLPRGLRERGYRMIKGVASHFRLDCHICGCKNPDLRWDYCNPWVDLKEG